MILDLFAGPGGWSEGLRNLGLTDVGIEWDNAACRTRAAAGHATIRADVAQYPTAPFVGKVTGLIASPPCQDFSVAGKRAGIDGERGSLVAEVMRWADDLMPEWIACEQVPPVLPIWDDYAQTLEGWGYSTWSGILNAANYGVPQTRKRAILIASRVGPARPPDPTHAKNPEPSLFGDELLPWVSMADALGWGYDDRGSPTVTGGGGATGGPEPFGNAARSALMSWVVRRDNRGIIGINTGRDWKPGGSREDAQMIPASEPAPTLSAIAGGQWNLTLGDHNGNTQWCWERPATTIAGDNRCWPPGHKINQSDRNRLGAEEAAARYGDRAGTDAVKLSVAEALVLQSFPHDYPVHGTKTKQFEQVGNAIPPTLAAAIVANLIR